jgi:hypothetical protein
VYEELLGQAAEPPYQERAHAWREAFLTRCGRFDPGDSRAESRDRAAWEDALVRGGLADELGRKLPDPAERVLSAALARAHRGVFVAHRLEATLLCRDLWSGAEFVLLAQDDVVRELAVAEARGSFALWQARLVATSAGCVVLPGAIFHPADAVPSVELTLGAARQRELSRDQALDALLLMEHTFRSLARVKVAYAYRPEALPR